jgi:plastocyanin
MWQLKNSAKLLIPLLMAACWSKSAMPAEIRGSVDFIYNGIFTHGAATGNQPIAVAVLPVGGKQKLRSKKQVHQVEITDNRILPSFLTAQRGDKIIFVNMDPVYHQLFSLSNDIPFEVTLEKTETGKPKQASLSLDKTGTVHIFCRIHNKSYARVDVLETPYQQMITSGQPFHFKSLKAGRWMLRLASPVAETRLIPVNAVTAPPPLKLELASHSGTSLNNLGVRPAIDRMYQ